MLRAPVFGSVIIMSLPFSSPNPIERIRTPLSAASLAASTGKESWSSPSVISRIDLEISAASPNPAMALRIGSSNRVPPRVTV